MESSISPLLLLIPSTKTYFLLLLQIPLQVSVHGLFHTHLHRGIPTNVTKHLYFPNFIPNPTTNHIKLLGSAIISQDKGFIQIPDPSPTLNHSYQSGRAIFSSPIRLFEPLTLAPASFNTTFSFHFTTDKELVAKKTKGGNGLAFVIVPDEFTVGRPGPWLGILNDACDHYKVLAIEFDTTRDPEVGDPNDDHVGINLGSIVSSKVANLSQAKVSLHDHLVLRAWIKYDGYKRWIEVSLGLDGDEIPLNPILSSSLNLAPFLNEYMFVGFSASTGNSAQIHNILSWNFTSSIQAFLHLPSKHICHKTVARQVSKYSSTAVNHSNPPSSFLIFVCVVGLVSLTLFSLYCNNKPQGESSLASVFPKKRRPVPPSIPRQFTYFEVCRATRCFSQAEVLSNDLRGVVLYKGTLENGCRVTIKRISTKVLNSFRVEWRRIVKRIFSITSISHPCLASIRGWCTEKEMIIVYDYHPNGSLDRWLFGLGVLPWAPRFKIITGIAEALCFLHSKELVHGNLKTSSIFLGVNYQPVLGDYEFNRLQGDSGKFKIVCGKKSDVFQFGMLVLEIVAGRRKLESDKDKDLLSFAWGLHERGEKLKAVDERLGPCTNWEQAVRALEVGLSCTLSENNGRPSMEEVVQFLNMQKQIPELPLSGPPVRSE
ncbi:unnamed protein product [Dovyalis caffra]|uniref:Protein kinase domain-containing protein n=1 Tax=Dovyalis caffra TaxID=77055 RepID=A0AAV1RHQ6_9ROSI|nr:unnamed protein product [Dovyalis caffra]